ncbi:Hypothetical predicted protein [Podarcis lilfordi]|uniref:Uncharacterized protein n=1 Tax=Podarcis lilfordi TaxID=74358 RepID=A0AA35PAT7_9SAUR|nr:Hypothetical predicted protein [Podarcis lilfordi]
MGRSEPETTSPNSVWLALVIARVLKSCYPDFFPDLQEPAKLNISRELLMTIHRSLLAINL